MGVVTSLGPLCEGAPPAGGGGESLAMTQSVHHNARFSPSVRSADSSLAEGAKNDISSNSPHPNLCIFPKIHVKLCEIDNTRCVDCCIQRIEIQLNIVYNRIIK